MCGIAVVHAAALGHAGPCVRAMLSHLRHRGFAHEEIWSGGGTAIGANRLQIVDPPNGRQPAQNEDGSVQGVLNGEIYNYRELRQHLQSRGHRFTGDCDTEVLPHAFEEWGLEMCSHLRGMFAFALVDAAHGKILLARDPMGVKPLYWGRGPQGCLLAASEAKALVGMSASVKLLPPAHIFDGVHESRYADDLPQPVSSPSFAASAAVLAELVVEAVKVRIPSLPFAVFLSGGVDSALLLAIAAQLRPDVVAISFGLPGSREVPLARELAQYLGVRHESVQVPFETLTSRFDEVIYHLESFEPNLVRASLITYALCERARQLGLRVAIAGEGADELFAGYAQFAREPPDSLAGHLESFLDDLHRTQLLRWDKMGMAHAVEVRTPFMDKRIVSLAKAMPVDFKMRREPEKRSPTTKAVLRAAASRFLPREVCEREKVPMDDGVAADGPREWVHLLEQFYGARETEPVAAVLRDRFSVSSREELVNLATLLRYLPPDFIDSRRARVREKPL